MANVKGISGYNNSQRNESFLLAAYGNDVLNVDTQTQSYRRELNVKSSQVELVQFLDSLFYLPKRLGTETIANGSDIGYLRPRTLSYRPTNNASYEWSFKSVRKAPFAQYALPFKGRMYFLNAYVTVNNYEFLNGTPGHYDAPIALFPSRLWHSELPDDSNEIQWGFDTGVVNTADVATSYAPSKGGLLLQNPAALVLYNSSENGFKTYKVKVGDPIFFYDATTGYPYYGTSFVQSVISDTSIQLSNSWKEIFQASRTGEPANDTLYFWVGSNWTDINTEDNDEGKWLAENNDRLLIFKRFSLWRWGGPGTPLEKVKGCPGTSSGRSVVNIGKDFTIYFHGGNAEDTGFYLYNGVDSKKISNPVQPFIESISSDMYDSIIGWKEGPLYRAYIGNLSGRFSSNDAFNISMSRAVFSWNSETGATSIDPIADVITAAGYMFENNQEKTFLGTDGGKIFQTPSGNKFNLTPIPFALEPHVIYPRGSGHFNNFTRVQIWGRDLSGVTVLYKLWNTPFTVDQSWQPLGSLKNDLTEIMIPLSHRYGSGIQFRFIENSTNENSLVIEKMIVWSVDEGTEAIDRNM